MTKHLDLKHTFTNENGNLRLFGISRFNLGLKPTVRQLLRWLNTCNKRAFKSYASPLLRSVVDELRVETTIPLNKVCQLYDSWNKEHEGWKMVALMKKHNLSFQSPLSLPKLLSLKLKMERNGKNPPWQDIKVSMDNGWYGYLNGRPRVSISLQGFVKNYCKTDATDEFLKDTINTILDYVEFTVKVKRFDGSSADDQLIENIYTKYVAERRSNDGNRDTYPSVAGSCMSKEAGDEDDDADEYFKLTEYHHPTIVYNHESGDVGIAWCEDAHGNTTMRCLLNYKHMTTCRYYGSSGGKLRIAEEREFFSQLEEHGFKRKDNGLIDCQLKLVDLCDGILMPYLDNAVAVVYDGVNLRVSNYEKDKYHGNLRVRNTNGVVSRPLIKCVHCGQRLRGIGAARIVADCTERPEFTCQFCLDKEKSKDETSESPKSPEQATAAGCA